MENLYRQYEKNSLPTLINVSGIYTIHYFKYGRNFRIQSERHNFWEMIYIDSGSAKVLAENKELTLKQGEAYFHKPNELHTIYTDEKFANSAIVSFECKSRVLKLLSDRIHVLDEYQKSLLNKIVQEALYI